MTTRSGSSGPSTAKGTATAVRGIQPPPAMKIVGVRPIVVGTPWRELTFVELVTDAGLIGVSEARMVNKTTALLARIEELAPRYVIGTDPFDVERLTWNVLRADYARPEEITQSALAAFEVASWDIIGQALAVPIWRLLGGRMRDRVPAYANGWYQSDRDPREIARLARRVVERGYRALKIDPFGAASAEISRPDLQTAIEVVAAVRETVGDEVQIMVEMHGRFTPAVASRVAARLAPYDPEWIEEPVAPENPKPLGVIRAATRLPIATGERAHTMEDVRPFIEGGLVDVVQVDLTHFGGFLAMKRLAGWADAYSLLMAPHNVCGPVGTMANVHFAACTPNYKVLEHFNDFADPWVQDLVDAPPRVDEADGCFALPERPGLGLRLNHDLCAKHPRTGGRISLFEAGWERRGFSGA